VILSAINGATRALIQGVKLGWKLSWNTSKKTENWW